MPEGAVEFGLRYDPEADETVAKAKTRLAQNWNCESVSLIFQGKAIEEHLLLKHVDQLTQNKQAKLHMIMNKSEPRPP